MKLNHMLTWVILIVAPSISSGAENSNPLSLLSSLNSDSSEIETQVIDKVNDLLNNGFPFLSIRHINNEDDASENGYALDYDYNRSRSNTDFELIESSSGLAREVTAEYTSNSFEFSANGSYTWADTDNIEDFSKIGLSAVRSKSLSNWNVPSRSYNDCVINTSPDDPNADETIGNCWNQYIRPGSSYAFELSLKYNVEGNHDFTEKQEAYGAHAVISYEPESESTLQDFNIFDIPFRWTRSMTDTPAHNAALPTLSFALEQVDPTNNTLRQGLLDADSTYDRTHFVAAFKTLAGNLGGSPVTFEWIYQRYDEIDAPSSVKAAGLDNFEYNKISFYFPMPLPGLNLEDEEIYIRYSSGSLPFDAMTDSAISIGWKSNLADLFN